MKKMAQASLEYLITYGWSLLLIAVIAGTLIFLAGPPGEQTVFSSSDSTKLIVKSGSVFEQAATIRLQNITGGKIKVNAVIGRRGYYNCRIDPENVKAGGEITVVCDLLPGVESGEFSVEFTDYFDLEQSVTIYGNASGDSARDSEYYENTSVYCSDGYDNDYDLLVDCADPDCNGLQGDGGLCQFGTETECIDGFDNDADGLTDCDEDSDCATRPECISQLILSCDYTISQEGNYKLTAPLTASSTNCITITASNVNLDCQNFTIAGSPDYGTYKGVYLKSVQNVTVKNCNITMFAEGILLESSSNNIISNTTTNSNRFGVVFTDSYYNTLSGITTSSNASDGIYFYKSRVQQLTNVTANSNGKSGILASGKSGSNTFTNVTANSNDDSGIFATESSGNNILTNVTTNDNRKGIALYKSGNNTFTGMTVNSNRYGFLIETYSGGNTIQDSDISDNGDGIMIPWNSRRNRIKRNTINNNGTAITILWESAANEIYDNTMIGNDAGIYDESFRDIVDMPTTASNNIICSIESYDIECIKPIPFIEGSGNTCNGLSEFCPQDMCSATCP